MEEDLLQKAQERHDWITGKMAVKRNVNPSPATLAISTLLKAGECVFQPLLWTKTVFHALRGAKPLFHALFCVKILSGTLFAPP